jgi:type VII secretion-associated protein (TIGR03931 family)
VSPSRVAVAPGNHAVRLAGMSGGGAPRLLAEFPARLLDEPVETQVLADLIGPDVDEVVLVYPPGRWSASTQAWLDAAATTGRPLHRVSAPVASAAGTGARAVLDVGRTGAEATLLHGDRIIARRSSRVGGDRLDLAVRGVFAEASTEEVRRLREALSLLPEARHGPSRVDAEQMRVLLTSLLDEAVAALAEVVAAAREPVAVLLTGGVARCPLLAERVDAAAFAAEVLVAPRPDLAAVLGALTLPLPPLHSATTPVPQDVDGSEVPVGEESARRFLPVVPASHRARRWGSAAAAALLVGGLAGAGTAAALPLRAPPASAATEIENGVLVQYGYRLDLPPGWVHTGGLPERRRSLLTRAAAPDGTDLIAVERTPLGYDAGAEPERAAADLRAVFDRAVAGGSALSGYGSARTGDRVVTTYVQQERAGVVVEWFVVLEGDAQLSVGCRHTPAGSASVRAACAVVVGSIRRA